MTEQVTTRVVAQRRPSEPLTFTCEICGFTFERRPSGKPPKVCGECRPEYMRRRRVLYGSGGATSRASSEDHWLGKAVDAGYRERTVEEWMGSEGLLELLLIVQGRISMTRLSKYRASQRELDASRSAV